MIMLFNQEFQELIENAVLSAMRKMGAELMPVQKMPEMQPDQEQRFIYSIQGLADFLNCSIVTAQKIKSSGQIPFKQVGRKVMFEKEAVLKAIERGNRK